jgi:DNA-binding transcriptional MerR regulator
MDAHKSRLLSIGEFAAATQLSPKALRLYAEQRLLSPAVIDAANGYRYYRDDQVTIGRLIRTLRDMDLPLASVAQVIAAPDAAAAEALLRRLADEGERRYARQRRALHATAALLRPSAPEHAPAIATRTRPAMAIAVRPFLAERQLALARFRTELARGFAELADAGIAPVADPLCVLVDPLSDEEGRLEVAIPIAAPAALPRGVTLRQQPARDCAVLTLSFEDAAAFDPTAGLDALFDWFDRRGCHAAEPPAVSFVFTDAGVRAQFVWAYEPVSTADPSR